MPDPDDFDAFVVASSQSALAKSWFAWCRVDGNPEPYVRQIIVTTHSSWWRRRWQGELPTSMSPSATLPDHDAVRDQTVQVDDRADLWQALGRLPARQRAVIVLRFYEDLTEAETAAALGVSVGTVKSQTSKAFARLRVDASLRPVLNGDDR